MSVFLTTFGSSYHKQEQVHVPAVVGVELLSLPQTRLWTLSALTQAGVWVQGLVPWTLHRAHTPAQLVVPPLASGTQLPLDLSFTLALT